jgi:aldose sugar dehydrogenase
MAVAVVLLLASCSDSTGAQDNAAAIESEEHRFRVVTVARGLENPWGIAFLPNGDMLVTERPGRIRLIRGGELHPEPVPGAPSVFTSRQGGLLDLALHPQFESNRLIYMSYSKPGDAGPTTAVARARFDGERVTDLEDVFVAEARGRGGNHFGSRIVFDGRGSMFVSIGDRGERDRAQSRSDHAGTVVRLHDDGRVPQDNPFVGQRNARPEIYTYGHRNAQGMALHPESGELWLNEHGPRGGDEINVVRAGRNYGWPVITHGADYSGAVIAEDTARAGMEQPLLHWTPSIAPSGMIFYTGDRFPNWRGNTFHGALAGQHLRRVVFEGERAVHQESLLQGRARIRTVAQGPDGFIYLLTDESNGALLRLEPVEGNR